jgi:hypothetical protein
MNKTPIADRIEFLDSIQFKMLVLAWLSGTEGRLDDFEALLDQERERLPAEDLRYGELDANASFKPLTESEMAAESLRVLEAYQRDRAGIPHERVQAWLDSFCRSIGSDEFTAERSVERLMNSPLNGRLNSW